MERFEIGRTYSERFACDYDQIASFTVLARTEKTVTVEVHGRPVVRRILNRAGLGYEQFRPFGSYSMAMVVDARNPS